MRGLSLWVITGTFIFLVVGAPIAQPQQIIAASDLPANNVFPSSHVHGGQLYNGDGGQSTVRAMSSLGQSSHMTSTGSHVTSIANTQSDASYSNSIISSTRATTNTIYRTPNGTVQSESNTVTIGSPSTNSGYTITLSINTTGRSSPMLSISTHSSSPSSPPLTSTSVTLPTTPNPSVTLPTTPNPSVTLPTTPNPSVTLPTTSDPSVTPPIASDQSTTKTSTVTSIVPIPTDPPVTPPTTTPTRATRSGIYILEVVLPPVIIGSLFFLFCPICFCVCKRCRTSSVRQRRFRGKKYERVEVI